MNTITINKKEYNVKYSIKALFYWEQITGKSFSIETLFDNYLLLYCMILVNNPDNVLSWDDFINALDSDPTIFKQLTKLVEDNQKVNSLIEVEDKKNGEKKI